MCEKDKHFVTTQWRKERRKKEKQLHLYIQNITQKTKDRATRIHSKSEVNSGAPEGLEVPSPHVTPVVLHKNKKDSSPFEK